MFLVIAGLGFLAALVASLAGFGDAGGLVFDDAAGGLFPPAGNWLEMALPGAAAGLADALRLGLRLALTTVLGGGTPALRLCDFFASFFFHFAFDLAALPDGAASGAGLGAILSWVISAAGLTPAAMAAFATVGESGACFAVPRKSGLTTIWRS